MMVLLPNVEDVRPKFNSDEDDDEGGSLSPDLCAADRAIDFSGFNLRLDDGIDGICLADELANMQFPVAEDRDSNWEDETVKNDHSEAPLATGNNENNCVRGSVAPDNYQDAITERFDRACRLVVHRSRSLRVMSTRTKPAGNSSAEDVVVKPDTSEHWTRTRDVAGQYQPEVVNNRQQVMRVSTSLRHLPDVVRDLATRSGRPSGRPPDLAIQNNDESHVINNVRQDSFEDSTAFDDVTQVTRSSPGHVTPPISNHGDVSRQVTADADDNVEDGSFLDTSASLMNWDYLEEQLSAAIEREKQVDERRQQRSADREEILRRLVAFNDEEDSEAGSDKADRGRALLRPGTVVGRQCGYRMTPRRPGLSSCVASSCGVCTTTPTGGATGGTGSVSNLQLCYVNLQYTSVGKDLDVITNSDDVTTNQLMSPTRQQSPSCSSSSGTLNTVTSSNSAHSDASSTAIGSTTSQSRDMTSSMTSPAHDFLAVQARLQAEARLALAQVRPMARMQLQLEKQSRKDAMTVDSSVFSGIGWLRDRTTADRCRLLQPMCTGQLFTVVNASIAAIKSLNAELMDRLVQRDTLHIVQDSLLVDIEDLTRRGLEYEVQGHKSVSNVGL